MTVSIFSCICNFTISSSDVVSSNVALTALSSFLSPRLAETTPLTFLSNSSRSRWACSIYSYNSASLTLNIAVLFSRFSLFSSAMCWNFFVFSLAIFRFIVSSSFLELNYL